METVLNLIDTLALLYLVFTQASRRRVLRVHYLDADRTPRTVTYRQVDLDRDRDEKSVLSSRGLRVERMDGEWVTSPGREAAKL